MGDADDLAAPTETSPAETGDSGAPSATAELPAEVVRRFRTGDRDALGEVYRRYCRPVWGVAMTVLHDRQLAEDSVSETFIRAWRSAPTFDPARPLAPWLFTLARRCAIDVHRRESRPTRGGHVREEMREDDGAVDTADISAAWEAWEVRTAVGRLPADEQTVVRLAHVDGLTHSEIAAELGVPLGTVKSRSHRAHRRLATSLRHLREESGR